MSRFGGAEDLQIEWHYDVDEAYLQGIDNTDVISTVRSRLAPTMPASAGLMM